MDTVNELEEIASTQDISPFKDVHPTQILNENKYGFATLHNKIGEKGAYTYCVHGDGAMTLPTDLQNNIYLGAIYSFGAAQDIPQGEHLKARNAPFPQAAIEGMGGSVDWGEQPDEAAARELWEELGIRVLPKNLHLLTGPMGASTAVVSSRQYVYWADQIEAIDGEGEKQITPIVMPIEFAYDCIRNKNPRFHDLQTNFGISMIRNILRDQRRL